MRFNLIVLLLLMKSAHAGDVVYPASAIPEDLKSQAHAVKRMEDITVEINQLDNVTIQYKYAITILDESGEQAAVFTEWYDKFRQITSVEGALYNAGGELVKKAKSKEFDDVSAVDEISLMDDNRLKHHQFHYNIYPYTVEYQVSIRWKQTFSLPSWLPQDQLGLSVENSRFTIIAPEDYVLRYKAYNFPKKPAETTEKNKRKYVWETSRLKALKQRFASPRWHELTTMVTVAPSDFEVDGYKGTMSSWKEFGQFINMLNKNRDHLPEAVAEEVKRIAATQPDDFHKVQALYNFLQKNTRYISIQLGIGGWQPFDAGFVAKNGYGDCKALTNYMKSILQSVGIRSHYALIKGGSGDTFLAEDFPSTQFNHVILCVPLAKDSLWLECTSQTTSAGYMGDFTGNRKALVITENGGQLISTPRYTDKENVQRRVVNAKLDQQGNLSLKLSAVYEGTQQDYLSSVINQLSNEKIQRLLQEDLALSTYEINNFDYKEAKQLIPAVNESLDLTVSNYATVSGKRLFIVPNVLTKSGYNLLNDDDRNCDFVFSGGYREIDSVVIELPAGYELESSPAQTNLETKFGKYATSVKVLSNKILFTRNFQFFEGRFPVSDQKELIAYYQNIYKADRSKLVFVKKETGDTETKNL